MGIITVVAMPGAQLYGQTRLRAVMYALFQRMQRAHEKNGRQGFVFFDEGHGEYRKMYRQARVHLPTGSKFGGWTTGASRNMPMKRFVKDANMKDSAFSWFIQFADLVACAAFVRAKSEVGEETVWQKEHQLHTLYDEIPTRVLNTAASGHDPQGIVWLKKP